MKRIHLLRTSIAIRELQPLFAATAALDLRVGWLDLLGPVEPPAQVGEAVALGAFRSVAVGADRVVTVKRVAGPKVLKDLLREHFAGCRLVVIRGEIDAPELAASAAGYRVLFEDGGERGFTAETLARALRRPRLRSSAAASKSGDEPE